MEGKILITLSSLKSTFPVRVRALNTFDFMTVSIVMVFNSESGNMYPFFSSVS